MLKRRDSNYCQSASSEIMHTYEKVFHRVVLIQENILDQTVSDYVVFQVRTERGVLPESDPRQTEAVMRRAIAAVEADNLPQAQAILEERIEVEREDLQEVGRIPFQEDPGKHTVYIYILPA